MHRLAGLGLVLAAVAAVPACTEPSPPAPETRHAAPIPSLAPVVQQVLPAVVNISVTRQLSLEDHPLLSDPEFRKQFDLPDELPEEEMEAVGSGVVVDGKAGHVLTNHHVIEGAHQITVTLSDGTALQTQRVLTDAGTDLALLIVQVPAGVRLQGVAWGNPSDLLPGDFVVAIGSPFGLDQSVSSGVVSALGRTGLGLQGFENFIQTDASVNPGSSGGALVNLQGELIGINNVILSPGGGNIGISFAIPSDMARLVIGQLLKTGKVERGHLGAMVRDRIPALMPARQIRSPAGVLVVEVAPDSPAAEVGLRRGDVISALDGEPVHRAGRLRNHIAFESVGRRVRLTVHRDGKMFVLTPRVELQQEADAAPIEHASLGEVNGAVPW